MFKTTKISVDQGKIVNIYTVYEIDKYINISSYSTLENCFFGAVKLSKDVDIDLCKFFDMVLDLI